MYFRQHFYLTRCLFWKIEQFWCSSFFLDAAALSFIKRIFHHHRELCCFSNFWLFASMRARVFGCWFPFFFEALHLWMMCVLYILSLFLLYHIFSTIFFCSPMCEWSKQMKTNNQFKLAFIERLNAHLLWFTFFTGFDFQLHFIKYTFMDVKCKICGEKLSKLDFLHIFSFLEYSKINYLYF